MVHSEARGKKRRLAVPIPASEVIFKQLVGRSNVVGSVPNLISLFYT